MTTSSKEFITNFRNARLNQLSSSPALLTRGDIQKQRQAQSKVDPNAFFNFLRMITISPEVEKAKEQMNPQDTSDQTVIPKAPGFKYKHPAIENNIAFWEKFADEGTMRHYDDLMGILDDIEKMDSKEDIRSFIKQLKDTTMYKANPGIQIWLGDLESEYYGPTKYDLSYPVDLMRHQTTKAKNAFDSGYRS